MLVCATKLQRLLAGCGLPGHLHAGAVRDDLLEPFSHDAVIVGDQNADHASPPSFGRGMRATRIVPNPGSPLMDRLPPNPSTLSRIPIRP